MLLFFLIFLNCYKENLYGVLYTILKFFTEPKHFSYYIKKIIQTFKIPT